MIIDKRFGIYNLRLRIRNLNNIKRHNYNILLYNNLY